MRKFKLTLLLLLAVLPLPGCSWFGFRVKEPSRPIEWIVGVDVTPTVKAEEFAVYPQIAAESVLACLRSRDRVYQLAINSDAEEKVTTFDIGGGKAGSAEDATRVYKSLQAIRRDRNPKVTTNLASLLSFVKKVVNGFRKERETLQQQGKKAVPDVQYVVVLFSDGLPDGTQTVESGDWPADVQVWAFGVKRENEAKFRELCVKQMKIPEANLHIKQFATWKSGVQAFGPAIGRLQNQALLKQITTGKKTTAGL